MKLGNSRVVKGGAIRQKFKTYNRYSWVYDKQQNKCKVFDGSYLEVFFEEVI